MAEDGGMNGEANEAENGPGDNSSGITPTRYCVLIQPDPEPDITKGGIMIPIQYREQKQAAAVTGRVIDIADEAFSFVANPAARRPSIGDRVAFTKYAGSVIMGADGQPYKLMNDEDISGILSFDPK